MIDIRNPNDHTDPVALGPVGPDVVIKSQTSYNEPGLPRPPYWGTKLGVNS